MTKLVSPNLKKIFGTRWYDQIPNKGLARVITKVDSVLSTFARYVGDSYENGEQTVFYKYGKWNITITIDDNSDKI